MKHSLLKNYPSHFEVRVCQAAVWICIRHSIRRHVGRERDSPYDGLERLVASKLNSACTLGASIDRAKGPIGPKDDFADMGPSAFQVLNDSEEILESGPHLRGFAEADPQWITL